MDHERLLGAIERYLRVSGMSAAKFGKDAMGDPLFVYELRAGREPRSRTIQRAAEWMRDNPPKKAA